MVKLRGKRWCSIARGRGDSGLVGRLIVGLCQSEAQEAVGELLLFRGKLSLIHSRPMKCHGGCLVPFVPITVLEPETRSTAITVETSRAAHFFT